MAISHRSRHIPLTWARFGARVELRADLALATQNRYGHDVDRYVTTYSKYIIRAQEAYAAPTLAYKFYGSVDYWWFLMWYNGIVNPTRELHAGLEIKVPDRAQMMTYLSVVEQTNTDSFVRL